MGTRPTTANRGSRKQTAPRDGHSWTTSPSHGILGPAVITQRRSSFALADEHVREALIRHLAAAPSGESGRDRIVEELGLCQGAARVDLAMIRADGIWGYEIKSDRDSLNRLVRQTEWYSRVLDVVVVVAGETHCRQLEERLPDWWGLWIASGDPDRVLFSVVREPQRNPRRDIRALVQLLWRAEALSILTSLGLSSARADNRRMIWERLVASRSEDEVAEIVRRTLRERSVWPRQASVQFLADVG